MSAWEPRSTWSVFLLCPAVVLNPQAAHVAQTAVRHASHLLLGLPTSHVIATMLLVLVAWTTHEWAWCLLYTTGSFRVHHVRSYLWHHLLIVCWTTADHLGQYRACAGVWDHPQSFLQVRHSVCVQCSCHISCLLFVSIHQHLDIRRFNLTYYLLSGTWICP